MPEGPEIEANRRLVARLIGRRITRATALEQGGGPRDGLFDASVMDDPDADAASVEAALLKAPYIRAACRRGKQLWVELAAKKGGPPSASLLVHCGMTGSLVLQDTAATPYKNFTVDESQWPPRFTKLELEFDQGPPLAFCDPRRFGRLRLRGAARGGRHARPPHLRGGACPSPSVPSPSPDCVCGCRARLHSS